MSALFSYNTSLVILSMLFLGTACGIVGSFIYLRRRAMLSDAISHATLPGIGIGFMVALALGLEDGRHLPTLLIFAALTATLGGLSVQWIIKNTRLREDTAIGSMLSVFFGLGVVLLSIIQRMGTGSKAGLDTFLLGQVAGLNQSESWLIMIVSLVVICVTILIFKELTLLCFDKIFAKTSGQPVSALDLALLALMVTIVCTGLKTVGLVLILALLIVPAVTARLWTHKTGKMIILAGIFGAISCIIGSFLSATLPNLPTGAMIVLTAASFFFVSFVISPVRGLLKHAL